MGTNYYAREGICEHCGSYKNSIHIGKSSAGWTFTFHATDEIRNYQQWLHYLSQEGIEIFNEYDDKFTIEDFKDIVESKKEEKFKHAVECDDDSYLDKEDNSFSPHEFS